MFLKSFLALITILFIYFLTNYSVKNEKIKKFIVKNKIFHPNSISYIRIFLWFICPILYYYWFEYLAIFIFSIAVISDYSDWVIARWCNLVTEKWKSLDPLSDKLVYLPFLIFFWIVWVLNIYLSILLVVIDTIWQFSRLIAKNFNLSTQANYYWKIKTTCIFLLLFLILFLNNDIELVNYYDYLNILLVACIVLAILSIVFKFKKV